MHMTSTIRSSLATALLILISNLAYAAQANGQVDEALIHFCVDIIKFQY